MSLHRFFLTAPLPKKSGGPVHLPLSADDVHHATSVLRVRTGEKLEVVEPTGDVWVVEVNTAGAHAVSASVIERLVVASADEPYVVLVQGVAKGEAMDDIVRHAVEIGASEILPVLFARTVVKLPGDKRAERGERWRRIAKSAAEQAHRDRVPQVHDPVHVRDLAGVMWQTDATIVLWEEASAEGQGIAAVLREVEACAGPHGAPRVALVVGPEGGLTSDEVEELVDFGARVATLGRNVLRAETAALTGLALVVHELGGLGNAR